MDPIANITEQREIAQRIVARPRTIKSDDSDDPSASYSLLDSAQRLAELVLELSAHPLALSDADRATVAYLLRVFAKGALSAYCEEWRTLADKIDPNPQRVYTVIGVYADPMGQRFATTVEAKSPEAAELAARAEADEDLIVAGVIAGEHQMLDAYTDGYSFGVPGQ